MRLHQLYLRKEAGHLLSRPLAFVHQHCGSLFVQAEVFAWPLLRQSHYQELNRVFQAFQALPHGRGKLLGKLKFLLSPHYKEGTWKGYPPHNLPRQPIVAGEEKASRHLPSCDHSHYPHHHPVEQNKAESNAQQSKDRHKQSLARGGLSRRVLGGWRLDSSCNLVRRFKIFQFHLLILR